MNRYRVQFIQRGKVHSMTADAESSEKLRRMIERPAANVHNRCVTIDLLHCDRWDDEKASILLSLYEAETITRAKLLESLRELAAGEEPNVPFVLVHEAAALGDLEK